MSWNGITLIGYVNGQEVDRYNTSICPASDSTRFSLGRGAVGTNRFFNGIIDQVKIYNYVRTPAQIAWDYNRGAPISHWKFDECQGNIAYDASGVGLTGTITIGSGGSQSSIGTCQSSGAWYNSRTGKINSAMSFDGTDDWVSIPYYSDTYGTKPYSASFWIKPSMVGSTYTVIDCNNWWGNAIITSGTNVLFRRFNSGFIDAIAIGVLSIDNWTHITTTFDSTNGLKIYANGALKGSNPNILTANYNMGGYIGKRQDGNDYFPGLIDDVRIYNYALTADQVKSIYNNNGAINIR
jgi:hypothetical protein